MTVNKLYQDTVVSLYRHNDSAVSYKIAKCLFARSGNYIYLSDCILGR